MSTDTEFPAVELDQPPESIAYDLATRLEFLLDNSDDELMTAEQWGQLKSSQAILEKIAGIKS